MLRLCTVGETLESGCHHIAPPVISPDDVMELELAAPQVAVPNSNGQHVKDGALAVQLDAVPTTLTEAVSNLGAPQPGPPIAVSDFWHGSPLTFETCLTTTFERLYDDIVALHNADLPITSAKVIDRARTAPTRSSRNSRACLAKCGSDISSFTSQNSGILKPEPIPGSLSNSHQRASVSVQKAEILTPMLDSAELSGPSIGPEGLGRMSSKVASQSSFRSFHSSKSRTQRLSIGSWVSNVDFSFHLHDEWLSSSVLAATMRGQTCNFDELCHTHTSTKLWGSVVRDANRNSIVLHPDHLPCILWSILSCMVMAVDVIMLPLAFIQDEPFLPAAGAWFVAVWWTVDVMVQLFTGFHADGLIELRSAKTMQNYARRGMVIDIPLLFVDWFTLFAESYNGQHSAVGVDVVRLGRSLRSLRIIRLVRVVRLFKVMHVMNKLINRLPSATVVAVARMFNLVLGMLVMCHYIACMWCGLARIHASDEETETWMKPYEDSGHGTRYQYALALHWALTQFMPAPTDVKPMNVHERSFAICVVLFALIVFSSIVGSISAKITEIRALRSRELKEERHVREYLGSKRVSVATGLKIWGFLKSRKRIDEMLVESDVLLLSGIPLSIRSALRTEVHLPMLSKHGLFLQTSQVNMRPMVALCCFGMAELSCKSSQELFVEGNAAQDMYFVVSGELEYQTQLYGKTRIVKAGGVQSWVCEVALWGLWVHCGQMVATTSCDVTALNARKFRDVMTKTHVHGGLAMALKKYAAAFAELVRADEELDEPVVTDVLDDPLGPERLVEGAFRHLLPTSKAKMTYGKQTLPDNR